MPTEDQVVATMQQISNIFDQVGDEIIQLQGPEQVEDAGKAYYLHVESEGSRFYVAGGTELAFMSVFYPYSVARFLGRQLSINQLGQLVTFDGEFRELEEATQETILEEAGMQIIMNTSETLRRQAYHNISICGSSDSVDIDFSDDTIGVVRMNRALYPYESISIENINDRAMSVVNLGKRVRRYVEKSLYIRGEEDEEEQLHMGVLF